MFENICFNLINLKIRRKSQGEKGKPKMSREKAQKQGCKTE
jgi:hypothetical protein